MQHIKEAYVEGEGKEKFQEQKMKKTEKKGRTRRESVADEVEEEGEGKRLY